VSGDYSIRNGVSGIWIGTSRNLIGGSGPGAGNLISGNAGPGIRITGNGTCLPGGWSTSSSENRILGNTIGTNPIAHDIIPNATGILIVSGACETYIGDSLNGSPNLIAGNTGPGIYIAYEEGPEPINNYIRGTLIGISPIGLPMYNKGPGIYIKGASNTRIGDVTPNTGNVIAFNLIGGVKVHLGVGNSVLRNIIFANVGQGIDLGYDGITPNDDFDADEGANRLQNSPKLMKALVTESEELTVEYQVNSDPANADYPLYIQFFNARNKDQGAFFLGEANYTEDDFKTGIKTCTLGDAAEIGVGIGDFLVATATDGSGNTSEFSAIVEVHDYLAENQEDENVKPVGIRIYPNPANDRLNIELLDGQSGLPDIEIISLTGRTVYWHRVDQGQIDVSGLARGLYFIRVRTENKIFVTRILLE